MVRDMVRDMVRLPRGAFAPALAAAVGRRPATLVARRPLTRTCGGASVCVRPAEWAGSRATPVPTRPLRLATPRSKSGAPAPLIEHRAEPLRRGGHAR